MGNLLYRLINPPIRSLLRSPFHGLMSKNTLLLEFTGRNSGRSLSTPISYYLSKQTAHCFTSRSFSWWRNLTTGAQVQLVIKGKKWQSIPIVEIDDDELMRAQLDAFLRAVPRDAAHAGVLLDNNGHPDHDDICRVIPDMVYLQFSLEHIRD
jgi:hypothetical protein